MTGGASVEKLLVKSPTQAKLETENRANEATRAKTGASKKSTTPSRNASKEFKGSKGRATQKNNNNNFVSKSPLLAWPIDE